MKATFAGKTTRGIGRALFMMVSFCFILFTTFVLGAGDTEAATSTQVVTTSATSGATQASPQRNIVRTSDGTLHAFVNTSTQTITCGSSLSGLFWFDSTDNGATWTCQGQLSSNSTRQASATVDSSDNI